MKYSSCFFDLYGTLLDIRTDQSMPSLWHAAADWYASFHAVYAPQELQAEYLRLVRAEEDAVTRAFAKRGILIRYPEPEIGNVFSALFRSRGISAKEDLVRDTAQFFRVRSRIRLRPYAGAADLLISLKQAGKRVYLLSNAQRLFTENELKETGLYGLFDDIFISSDAGVKKPDPLFFSYALEKTGSDPADCLMVGNDLECDIEGALSAGMKGYYIHSVLSPGKDRAKTVPEGCIFQDGMDLKLVRKRIIKDDRK